MVDLVSTILISECLLGAAMIFKSCKCNRQRFGDFKGKGAGIRVTKDQPLTGGISRNGSTSSIVPTPVEADVVCLLLASSCEFHQW